MILVLVGLVRNTSSVTDKGAEEIRQTKAPFRNRNGAFLYLINACYLANRSENTCVSLLITRTMYAPELNPLKSKFSTVPSTA